MTLDVRDISRDGFLLSLTVLPSVLHECVHSVASTSEAAAAFMYGFVGDRFAFDFGDGGFDWMLKTHWSPLLAVLQTVF